MTLAYQANIFLGMKLTLQLQLLPDPDQALLVRTTVERFNEAATWLAGIALEHQCANKIALQKLAYYGLRERFGLPADTAIRCIAQVVEAYKRDKTVYPTFRPHAAVPFSMGRNIGFKSPDRVRIATLDGRVIVPYLMGVYQQERFGFAHGQTDLVLRRDGVSRNSEALSRTRHNWQGSPWCWWILATPVKVVASVGMWRRPIDRVKRVSPAKPVAIRPTRITTPHTTSDIGRSSMRLRLRVASLSSSRCWLASAPTTSSR